MLGHQPPDTEDTPTFPLRHQLLSTAHPTIVSHVLTNPQAAISLHFEITHLHRIAIKPDLYAALPCVKTSTAYAHLPAAISQHYLASRLTGNKDWPLARPCFLGHIPCSFIEE